MLAEGTSNRPHPRFAAAVYQQRVNCPDERVDAVGRFGFLALRRLAAHPAHLRLQRVKAANMRDEATAVEMRDRLRPRPFAAASVAALYGEVNSPRDSS